MKRGRLILLNGMLVSTLLLVLQVGCTEVSETDTPTNSPAPTSTLNVEATPTTASVYLGSGAVIVYFQASLGGGTSYHTVKGQTLVMKGSGGGVFRYLSEQDDVTLVEDYVSPDYARNELHPYTVDGRLFLVQIWPDSHRADFDEFNPTGDGKLDDNIARVQNNSPYSSWSKFAVVGNNLYYQTARAQDLFAPGGYSGGGLMVKDLDSDARDKVLLSYDDPDNYGALHSAGDDLYRVNFEEDYHLIRINRIDLNTGRIAWSLEFSIDDYGSYTGWSVATDQNALYMAAVRKVASAVNLWRISWIDLEKGDISKLNLVHSQDLEDDRDGLLGLDADDGYVVLELFTWGKGTFILYDYNTGDATTIKPGHDPRFVQILKVR